jgi:hypothetical protein
MTSVPGNHCAGDTAATSSAATSIQGLQSELRQLMSQVAKELSSLARSLQPISAQAREVTSCCRRAAEISAASQSGSAMDVLEQLLSEAEQIDLLETSSRDLLRSILGHLEASRNPLTNLIKLPFLLNTVGMLARIEVNRLSSGKDADVASLAGDISNIAHKIESHVTGMADQGEKLPALVAEGLQRLDEICGVRRQEETNLKARTQAVLEPLRARTEKGQQATRDIDERYKRIRTAIEGIVMSLQCEDIARQRLEHVQQVLGQLNTTQTGGAQATAGVLALQRAQLLSTRDLVSNSVSSFLASIRSLISNVAELTAEVEALANQTGEDKRSFSVAMAEGLQAVSTAQEQYSASTRTVVSAVEKILPPVASMTKGATELRAIAASIRRTALNARIETAHLGQEGATMRALATEVQQITEGSEGEARIVLDHLLAADGDLNSISKEVATASQSRLASTNGNGCAEVVSLIESVKVSGQQMTAELAQLLQKSGELRAQLEATGDLAERCAQGVNGFNDLVEHLDSVLAPIAGEAGVDLSGEAASRAAGLNELYSMQSEREVHEQLFGVGATGSADAGADVELF